jgi:hypothetical protein
MTSKTRNERKIKINSNLVYIMYFKNIFKHCFVLGVFEKLRKACVCPHVATRLPVQGYLFNVVYD